MANRLVSLVALAVAVRMIMVLRRTSRPRADAAKGPPMPVQTWEGEGGALPASGAQMGPDPAVGGAMDDDVRRDSVITGIH